MFDTRRKNKRVYEIAPEDIFLDSSNLPGLDASQFEGRVEKPISRIALIVLGCVFGLTACAYSARAFELQVKNGEGFSDIAKNNTIDHTIIFAARGILYDRSGEELAWNEPQATSTSATSSIYALRAYTPRAGFSHLLGYVQYPKKDASGNWWRTSYAGVSGVELTEDNVLSGQNGEQIEERDARGKLVQDNIVSPAVDGKDVHLSIDADIQNKLYELLSAHARANGFQGGAAVVMDVRTGELIAITSFPEYDHHGVASGNTNAVLNASNDPKKPLLNRAVAGLYAPGSIVKTIFAAAALDQHIISPDTTILSTGALILPNPYDPEHPSVFHDWRAHGLVNMREAIAVSSDEYFYTIGGGFGSQAGLGIQKLDEYARKFGLGSVTGIALKGEQAGVIPTPAWKEQVFGVNDPWRIGDTYHTAIGQFGFQITPIQAVRFVSAIANGGTLFTPQLIAHSAPVSRSVGVPDEYLQVVRDGMRLAVTSDRSDATVKALDMGGIHIAAKTGTAQIGAHNEWMNSWSVGFWPADNPKYAYAVVLERAPAGTLSGAAPGLRPFFEWLITNKPEYVD